MGLTLLQPTNLKDTGFVEQLRAMDANLQVVVAFRMLPRVVWEMPEYGTFNLHASLLPDYRGAAPINWAIMNGENETGVTTFFIDEKIDTGAVILQKGLPIARDETAGSLHDKLMAAGAGLVLKTLELIALGTFKLQVQESAGTLKTAPKIEKETCRINWDGHTQTVYDHIRGLSPYPGAWTLLHNGGESIQVKIFQTGLAMEPHNYRGGHIISTPKEIRIAASKGFIIPEEIQLAGKRRMKVKEVLNGLKLENDAYMS
jgi:methionyl-tRNA formyltransferase